MTQQYNTMQEHNYFRGDKKKNVRYYDKKVNHTEKVTNDFDEYDSTIDWSTDLSTSDVEEDIEDMPLSHLLKIEYEKDLFKKCKKKKSSKDQLTEELNNKNNHNLLNTSNNSNNIISENHPINNGNKKKIEQIVPLTNNTTIIQNQNITNEFQTKLFGQSRKELVVKNNFTYNESLPNVSMNKKARTDHYNNNLQALSFSLDTNNPIIEKDNVNVPKTSADNVCPPLNWIHLIYLAIKNSATENVSCYDIQNFVRYWFPYYKKNSYIRSIRSLLRQIVDDFHEKYFCCNPLSFIANQRDTWTINTVYINTLEESLIETVVNNEDQIKSAMANPDKLSTLVNGYGVFYLGFNQNIEIIIID